MQLLLSGGPVLVAILLVSLYALYIFFERLFKLSREPGDADALMARVNAAVKERNLGMAQRACEQHGGPVARVLRAALERLPYGRSAVEAAFQEASLQEEQSLTRGLRPLATIAQVAPLLGLLGTVTGMIIAFSEISSQGTGNPAALADGIGQALVNHRRRTDRGHSRPDRSELPRQPGRQHPHRDRPAPRRADGQRGAGGSGPP